MGSHLRMRLGACAAAANISAPSFRNLIPESTAESDIMDSGIKFRNDGAEVLAAAA